MFSKEGAATEEDATSEGDAALEVKNFIRWRHLDSEEDLKAVGLFCLALHSHYMLESANGVDNIGVSFQACHFGSTADNFYVGFSDLYDLLHLDALDMSLLRCFSL